MSQHYIYKIVSDDLPDYAYVGSTKSMKDRKYHHKKTCNNPNMKNHNLKVYQTIRENGGWENWRMVLVEECGEISNNQARIREEHYRLKLNANMNTNRACILVGKKEHDKQLYASNREEKKAQAKQNYAANKEMKLNYALEKVTCECGCVINKGHLSRHKKTTKHTSLLEQK